MLIESTSQYLLKKTRAKAKMYEYNVPIEQHIYVEDNVPDLLLIAVGAIGNISAAILRNLDEKDTIVENHKKELEFSSKFFDSFLNSKIDDDSQEYYLLLGSVAYFLCDYIGSSKVLANKLKIDTLNLNTNGIEQELAWLLVDNYNIPYIENEKNPYNNYLKRLNKAFLEFKTYGKLEDNSIIFEFRKIVYEIGSSLELLLIDALLSIFILKINHSAVKLLPQYTEIDEDKWKKIIVDGNFISELWPSQRRLGEAGIFNGKSAVVQMPTSSGKTKSISLAICSAFLAERTSLAVIVAPFRALCREISLDLKKDFNFDDKIHIDEMSDVLQMESLIFDSYKDDEKTVLVVTPEKLIYLLRQRMDLIEKIGLIIFDEGHLFDEPYRGATYELLISTIKGYLKENSQKILVSAVIPNAEQLNSWLNDGTGVVIADNTIKATETAIAITDWELHDKKRYGYLYFVNPENPEEEEFYVPRLVDIKQILKRKGERKERYFPEVNIKKSKVLHNDIAIYFGLKLCGNGGVAIFCGKKDTANNILWRIDEIEERGYDIKSLLNNSDIEEVNKISDLIQANYGEDNIYYIAARKAAFVHHSGISNGIKISIEYAMKKQYLKFLVCTSTLAQGVNLPIRYLIISSVYQGKDRIRVRDFHNLIGRAGRSGIYTEGNIILSETFVYANRKNYRNRWKWNGYKELINVKNSEACSSMLLEIIRDFQLSDDLTISFDEVIKLYYTDDDFESILKGFMIEFKKNNPESYKKFEEKLQQIYICLDSIESFLMLYLVKDTYDECIEIIENILKNTLAFNLASDEEKQKLLNLFEMISKFTISKTNDSYKRYMFSKSLLGIRKILKVEEWIFKKLDDILECDDTEELFVELFSLIYELSDSKVIKKVENSLAVQEIAVRWMSGDSYYEILTYANAQEYKIESRNNIKDIELDDVINLCDSGLGYACTLVITAITEIVISKTNENSDLVELLRKLSSQLKYGLNSQQSIVLYELGFSDRVVAGEISNFLKDNSLNSSSKKRVIKYLKQESKSLDIIINKYPSVFSDRLKSII